MCEKSFKWSFSAYNWLGAIVFKWFISVLCQTTLTLFQLSREWYVSEPGCASLPYGICLKVNMCRPAVTHCQVIWIESSETISSNKPFSIYMHRSKIEQALINNGYYYKPTLAFNILIINNILNNINFCYIISKFENWSSYNFFY